MTRIPPQGLARDELFRRLEAFRSDDLDTTGGRTWAYVYDPGRDDIGDVAKQAFTMYLSENGLDPTVFPSLMRMENDVVAMAAAHLNGDDAVSGSFTSGGTESCMLAVKTARDRARTHRPEVTEPEMILPVTAHAAFRKAGHYFGVKEVPVPVDPHTFRADPEAVAQAVGPNTVLIVGSAVSYAHGVVDPIAPMAAVAEENDVLMHVDGCIGGFLLPFFRRLGDDVPDFDFTVPGVTSISMDFHKYAYAPKGASVVLYRDRELRKHQLYACASWTGYTIINPTMQSTKSGGPLAATWAVLNFLGDTGYLEIARRTREATRRLVQGIGAIPDLRVLGRPEMSLVAATSDTVDVFTVIDEMKQRGWYVQPQLTFQDSPANIHFSVTSASLERVDAMLADLEASVAAARKQGVDEGAQQMSQALAQLDPDALDAEQFDGLMEAAGMGGDGALPERMAGINTILDGLPPALRERLLIEFVNRLFR